MDIDLSYLDPRRFESLASDLLMEEAESVRTIDGSGGDDGIDCFKGQTQGNITIFNTSSLLAVSIILASRRFKVHMEQQKRTTQDWRDGAF
jgi:hypothetical protein